MAKEGYANLLPVQNKKSLSPGDSADMIRARRRFLDQGYYAGFAQFLVQQMSQFAPIGSLLDIGCGEGYYLNELAKHLTISSVEGIDISKHAIKMCAKKLKAEQLPKVQLSVASAYDLPYFDSQIDSVLSIFSPIRLDEVYRVLRPQGKLFLVGPGPGHLHSLAARVYDEAQAHKGNKAISVPENLKQVDISYFKHEIKVEGGHIPDLLLMTPYYWSCSEENKLALARLEHLTVEMDFEIRVFVKD